TAALAVSALGSPRNNGKRKIEFTTSSSAAKDLVAQIVSQIETLQAGPQTNALAKKAVEADPNFAFGYYLLGTPAPTPPAGKQFSDKAVELSRNASEGERRYIEAVLLTRAQKTNEALPLFLDLQKQFPDDRMVAMLLGQVYTNLGKLGEAKAAFDRAIQLDGSPPRVYTFIGNIDLLKGDYAKARQSFNTALSKQVKNSAPFG